jgi:hypothetical protein
MKWLIFITVSLISLPSNSSSLSQTQIHSIETGYNFSYSQEFIDASRRPVFYNKPRDVNLDLPKLKQPASALSWATFYGLQVLDVYTTDRALQYNCIQEINPLLGDRPSVQDMVALKTILFGPALWNLNKNSIITDDDLVRTNYIMTVVVINNFEVLSKVKTKSSCAKL